MSVFTLCRDENKYIWYLPLIVQARQHSLLFYFCLQTVKCLLIYPNPESALNEEAGKLLLEHYDDYSRHARLITSIHAQRPSSSMATDDTAADTQMECQSKKRPHERVAVAAPPAVDKKKKDKKKALRRL